MNMNEYSLEGFEQIWARVQGAPAPEQPDPDAELLRFLEQEAECTVFERCLAGRYPGLEALRRATCRRFQALREAWFLRTGERFSPAKQCCVLQGSVLQDLRRDYLKTKERAERYAAAAGAASDEELCALYAALARETAEHAEKVKKIIRRVLDAG